MDRFRWCTDLPNSQSSETTVAEQLGVRLYNGSSRTSFEDGLIKLTTHRLIWISSNRSTSAIALPLLAVTHVAEEHEGRRSTPKIAIRLLSVIAVGNAFKAVPSPPAWAADWIVDRDPGKRVAIASGLEYVRLGFTKSGTKEFAKALLETVAVRFFSHLHSELHLMCFRICCRRE